MSFLEMLDVVNEQLMRARGGAHRVRSRLPRGHLRLVRPDDQRCGPRPDAGTATCQLHMRSFKDGDTIYVEPWRARAFPIVKDLVVDRSAFDRIIQAGGYITAPTGGAQDANTIPIPKDTVDTAMDAAQCIGCGACVAACPNASASLFTAAKISHLGLLPQGQPERYRRALRMVAQMDIEHFGGCTLYGECQEACPKEISIDTITRMNRDFLKASLSEGRGAVAKAD